MATATRDDVTIQMSEEPENLGWLYEIIEKQPGVRRKLRPLIQRAPETLREFSRNKTCFEPSVVSFGPYHHEDDHLWPMGCYKEVTALWFINLSDNTWNAITREGAKQVYDEFVANAPSVSSLRDCYANMFPYSDADFMRMMFLDGCFMLYFIVLFLDQSSDPLETSHLTQSGDPLETGHLYRPLIVTDMFLLENQIPYSVLAALKSLLPKVMLEKHRDDWAAGFFKTVFLPPLSPDVSISLPMVLTSLLLIICTVVYFIIGGSDVVFLVYMYGTALLLVVCWHARRWICCCRRSEDSWFAEGPELQIEPLHLLDLLRSELTGKGVVPSDLGTSNYRNYNSHPISVLKAAGIQVRVSKSRSLSLKNIKLKKGWIDSYLELPRMIIDDSTKTRLLNLAAYEMCADNFLGQQVITSYICFLSSLIYNADDVKELRSSNIMLNRLGSDEEVANLFRELATDLPSLDINAYSNVIREMELHFHRRFHRPRMWIGQFGRIYFASPLTAISFTAASSVIFLTLVQTIYSVVSYNKSG